MNLVVNRQPPTGVGLSESKRRFERFDVRLNVKFTWVS